MRIVLVQRLIPVYREVLFEALRMRCADAGHTFELWTSDPADAFVRRGTHGALSWATRCPVRRLPGGLEWQRLPWRDVLGCDLLIVPDQLRTLSNFAAIALRRLAGRPVLTWGHGRNFQPNALSRTLARMRLRLMGLAHGHLLYTDQCRAAMLADGVPDASLRVVENAPDTRGAEGLGADHDEVRAFRGRWALDEAPCIAFLGSWYVGKRPEWIIEIGERIRQSYPQARMIVIGGGDGLDALRAAALPWLVLTGPLHGREKFVALSASRCLCVTGVAGLNVLDAMIVGLPVVLPRRQDHSPEVFYAHQGVDSCWVDDDPGSLAAACVALIADTSLADRLGQHARAVASLLSADTVARNLLEGATSLIQPAVPVSLPPVVVVYQRMLPYHRARFAALWSALARQGRSCIALEVTNTDSSYGDQAGAALPDGARVITLFPNTDYLRLTSRHVARAVRRALQALGARAVFAPAPAFAEGAGALHHKIACGGALIQMDDAWSATDHRVGVTRHVKRWFNGYVDGAFLPDPLHGRHFESLNVPADRQGYAVDVVADVAIDEGPVRSADERDVLFVGRLVKRKGLETVLHALAGWMPDAPRLVVIGDGPERERLRRLAAELGLTERTVWLGHQDNSTARQWMARAMTLVVPSDHEQWGLVVNEAWQAGLPVLGSNTVGALRAGLPEPWAWTMLPVGDVDAWRSTLRRAASMDEGERRQWIETGRALARRYSIERHVESALRLLELPPRRRPWFGIGWLARLWVGRVVIW